MKSTAEGKYQVDFMDRDGQPFLQKKDFNPKKYISFNQNTQLLELFN